MTRRTLGRALAGGFAARLASAGNDDSKPAAPAGYSVVEMGGLRHFMPNKPEQIAMLIYPGMTALDLIGPQQAFGYMMGAKVNLIWKTLDPITSDTGVKIIPSATFHDTNQPDILFVPGGGKGTIDLMSDSEVTGFLAEKGKTARWVTSVCSGSLVLGAAGLLRGYRATSHWAVRDVLTTFGAELAPGRIVEDRNRITAGGITAGIDFGLYLVGKLRGEDYGRVLELSLKYDPHPPFHSGTPAQAPTKIRDAAVSMYAPLAKSALASAEAAVQRQRE